MFLKYTIKNDDNLDDVALRFNSDKDEIMDINNIYFPDTLRDGMDIVVPSKDNIYFDTYVINKGDTLFKIAKEYDVNSKLLALLNGLNMDDYIYTGQEIMIPKKGYSYYITVDGDTIDTVSDAFLVDKSKLLEDNPTIYLLKDQVLVFKK